MKITSPDIMSSCSQSGEILPLTGNGKLSFESRTISPGMFRTFPSRITAR
jgi:hypothetical protein